MTLPRITTGRTSSRLLILVCTIDIIKKLISRKSTDSWNFSGGAQQDMKRQLYALAVLCIGLLSAQIVATAHVYLSNLNLLQATEAVAHSGYLAVPNALVTARLDTLATAMAGGVFFTLSIGSGLSLITLGITWLWDRAFNRRRQEALLFVLLWIVALYLINSDGFNVVASLYLIVVPLVTFIAAILLLPVRTTLISPTGVLWPISAALILTLIWGLVLDKHLFINIRDHLLLSNRMGEAISSAYYDYTLFPAEAFKSLAQKQIRTCVLKDSLERATSKRLEQTMRTHDYLPVPDGYPADLTIGHDKQAAHFSIGDGDHRAFTVSAQDLLGQPQKVLKRFSDQKDRNRMFRKLTLMCLLIGFPLVLYSAIFSLVVALPSLLFPVKLSGAIATFICIAIGVLLLAPVYQGHTAMQSSQNPITGLASTLYATRIATLRLACDKKQDIATEAAKHGIETSPYIAERYWLARSLSYANGQRAMTMLQHLAGDPSPVVACQALWAMGKRKDQAMIPQIIDRINTTPVWYIQMYAYRALRALGWVQPQSPLVSY